MKHIAIFASGSGTNAENIIKFFKKDADVKVSLVLSNRSDAYVLKRASELSTRTYVFDKAELLSKSGVLSVLDEAKIDLIVLAGFLWKFPTILLDKYVNKVINIHPALLPKYGGKGMYGELVHKAVVSNNETETGITIHFVNPNYDEGAIIFQAKCSIAADDDPVDVANKVHRLRNEVLSIIDQKDS
jgi:phosphoribosylglycinamide formyltransferase-1